jgi:gamma-glutamyltranspeptidase/glutathione hydrolase
LASKAYAEILAREIRMDRAAVVPGHGTPPGADREAFGQHTTHFSVADAAGNWVACTATINTSFGSKVVVPGTGVFLNNQMDDFALRPGVTNYFGLVGGEANAVRGGKRPLSSMSPTVVLREGRPVLAVGAAGGPTIVSQTVRAILNLVDFKMDPYRALAEPRLHHQWQPDVLRLERGFPAAVRRELERRGHRLRLERRLGAAQSVGAVPGGEFLQGAHDPRVAHGAAAGW